MKSNARDMKGGKELDKRKINEKKHDERGRKKEKNKK